MPPRNSDTARIFDEPTAVYIIKIIKAAERLSNSTESVNCFIICKNLN